MTEDDSLEPWLKCLCAVRAYVPIPVKDIALATIRQYFEPSAIGDHDIYVPSLTNKCLFMEPERTYKGSTSRKIYYKDMLNRHRLHTDCFCAEICYRIKVDLDREFDVLGQGTRLSLQDIILDLKVENLKNRMLKIDYSIQSISLKTMITCGLTDKNALVDHVV